jgi:hypothetical protein
MTADMSQNTIYKASGMSLARGPCLLYRLIDSSGLRDSIHKKYLVKGNAEDIQNEGFNTKRSAGSLFNDPVKSKSPSKNSLDQVNSKGPVPFTHVWILLESPFQVSFRKIGAIIQAV